MEVSLSKRITTNLARKERCKKTLLDAAGRVFARKGYHDTLVSDIAAEAKVGQGTFYRYFRDKREIIDALFDEFTAGLLAGFSDMSARLPTNQREYRAASIGALKKVAATAEQNRALALFFIREAAGIDREFEAKLHALYGKFAALAQVYLDHAIAGGFARPCNSAVVSQALIGIGVWMTNQWWNDRMSGVTVDGLIGELVDLAMYGFGVDRPLPGA
ncbi:MAG: TetR/AcrR family transcriptional regulator [Deltaproteobacteria bacterium]|nr:TetR/AcrR family transcriptional regulator [Deltaproteobacteria bacterium]